MSSLAAHYVNTACTHKRVTHCHGTRVCYAIDRCRCDLCRLAATMWARTDCERRNRAQYDNEKYAAYVDAEPARVHVRTLQAAGLGWKEVARRAGLNPSNLYPLLYGRKDRNGGEPRKQCRRSTRDAILSVPIPTLEELRPGRKVDAEPTANRIKALGRIGYSNAVIAHLAGVDRQRIDALTSANRTSTTAGTAATIRDLFNRVALTPCAGRDWHSRASVSRARGRAEREGWPSPLDLDDDGYLLDNPDAEPDDDIDHAAITRALAGDPSVNLTRVERLHVAQRILDQGGNCTDAASRAGVSRDAVHKNIERGLLSKVRAA